MNAFLGPLVLCFTVVAAMSFGVGAAYAAVLAILHSFGRASQPQAVPQRPQLVLVPSQTHASGD